MQIAHSTKVYCVYNIIRLERKLAIGSVILLLVPVIVVSLMVSLLKLSFFKFCITKSYDNLIELLDYL